MKGGDTAGLLRFLWLFFRRYAAWSLIAVAATDGDTVSTLAPDASWNLNTLDVGHDGSGAVTLGVWWKIAGSGLRIPTADESTTTDITSIGMSRDESMMAMYVSTGRTPRDLLVRPVEGGEEKIPGAIPGEHAPGPVGAMRGGRQADDANGGLGISERGNRASPIRIFFKRLAFDLRDPFAPSD